MRRYKSYKFTDKHHSKGGVRSSIAGAIALLCTILAIHFSFIAKGDGGNFLALFGVVAMAGCVYGAFEGSRSFKEEECYYLFSRLGTAVNLVLVIFWVTVVGMGILI